MQFMLLLPALPHTRDDAPRVFPGVGYTCRWVLRLNWLVRLGRELLRRFTTHAVRGPNTASRSRSSSIRRRLALGTDRYGGGEHGQLPSFRALRAGAGVLQSAARPMLLELHPPLSQVTRDLLLPTLPHGGKLHEVMLLSSQSSAPPWRHGSSSSGRYSARYHLRSGDDGVLR